MKSEKLELESLLNSKIFMHYLLSLPPNLVENFHKLTGNSKENYFVASDPPGTKIGSGGGTAYLLAEHLKQKSTTLENCLQENKRIIIHAGGQSRRLPAYAPAGKVLAPIPVFRWSRGQRLNQTLLDLQLPFLEKVMDASSSMQNTLIASGDVYIHSPSILEDLPEADIVCLGIWVDPALASRHGVFFTPRQAPGTLDFMLQKPAYKQIENLAMSHLFMMDIGVWLLSDKAVQLLMKKSGWKGDGFNNRVPDFYDLYSSFGTCLGAHPSEVDEEINKLSVAIVSLDEGEFYHYGTSGELISSTEDIQNRVKDQRSILHHKIKVHPSLFVQNAEAKIIWNSQHRNIWIENSHVNENWQLSSSHVITGIPKNTWKIKLPSCICLDIVPVGENQLCIRPYGLDDTFRGALSDIHTMWQGKPVVDWFANRGLDIAGLEMNDVDLQAASIFPVLDINQLTGEFIQWMINGEDNMAYKELWLNSRRLSADQICEQANLIRLHEQRKAFERDNLELLAQNHSKSVFYQSDLKYLAASFAKNGSQLPDELPANVSPLLRMKDQMYRSEYYGVSTDRGIKHQDKAFEILQSMIVDSIGRHSIPKLNIYSDQIIWGRSPARIDLAGGWSDTAPYCIQEGGSVVNVAVELNGQPPIQVYIRLSSEKKIILRSIDIGVSEVVTSFDELKNYHQVGSAFSIPKAALCLAGFHPDYCGVRYASLEQQLSDFGGGFEISMLVAIPTGSGLGTSSILGATTLGTLSDFCQLAWSQEVIAHKTLILEQLLTTGGGWQDQYGGILAGVKLIESQQGKQEKMNIQWLPDHVFNLPELKGNWLLYYTGITRVAKNLLQEIVRGMFLNESKHLSLIDSIKAHAYSTAHAIQCCDYRTVAKAVGRSWQLNKKLDNGTMTPEVEAIVQKIEDYALGYKLLGAGGGGYLLICAKDADAVNRIKHSLTANPPNSRARFVKLDVSSTGFVVSRS
ncbi:MAG: bifunctional fucokinase/fucose-1-phosphate guanylyltransferase [Carboxylicivirga sp.]|nr:bifunctional fucokinase/fucose-1-phosphate guanylyltransferase [Carboxylicivirga sp.]